METIPKIWSDPPIVVTVSRKDVESIDIQSTLDSLQSLLRDPPQAPAMLGRLVLSFEGFGKEAGAIWYDEVWQVPQARLFVEMLDKKFPFWFFLADLSGNTLYSVAACMCRIEARGAELIFNKEDLLAFSVRQYECMNQIFRTWNLPEEEESARVEALTKYFDGVPVE